LAILALVLGGAVVCEVAPGARKTMEALQRRSFGRRSAEEIPA
jgi:hypothetical protein